MTERPYELAWTADDTAARVRPRGSSALSSPLLNRGTALTLADQETLGLTGLLPRPAQRSRGSSRGPTGSTCASHATWL